MTREEYGEACVKGFPETIKFLSSKGARNIIEDIAQEAWMRGFSHLDQLHEDVLVYKWVNSIARNLYVETFRGNKMRERGHLSLVELPVKHSRTPNPASYYNNKITVDQILKRHCTDFTRFVLLSNLEGKTIEEFAAEWGTKKIATRCRILRARRAVRDNVLRREVE